MTDISIIILTYNEEFFITDVLNNVLQEDGFSKEIIIADAGSTDATLDIVKKFQSTYSNVSIYNNHERYVNKALNAVIPKASGRYIAVLGAHAVYPEHYIKTAISFLDSHPEYSIVGGPIEHQATSLTGKSIAWCMSSSFGMGGSSFRSENKDQDTDTVPFPVYKKEVFDQLNGYDNRLIRNQDEDFHYRAIKQGFNIFMLSELKSVYYVRETYFSLIRQFFQYGYFKPLVMKKNMQSTKLRHFIPLLFVLYLILIPAFAIIYPTNIVFLYPLFLYILIDLLFSFSFKNRNPVISLLNVVTFPVMHISYGAGTLLGLYNIYK